IQVYTMCVLRYEFYVLNHAFVVHRPGIKRARKFMSCLIEILPCQRTYGSGLIPPSISLGTSTTQTQHHAEVKFFYNEGIIGWSQIRSLLDNSRMGMSTTAKNGIAKISSFEETVRSDYDTNFIGASRQLQKIYTATLSTDFHDTVSKSISNDCITWFFHPAAAPRIGGLWEAAVKSAKFILNRVLKSHVFNFEEYDTILKEVEACMNSRPMCPVCTDPTDYEALTPCHFIIGEPLKANPELDLTPIKTNRLRRWQLQQQLKQHLWKRWHLEYLQQLQKRTTWKQDQPIVNIGDLVVLLEDNTLPQLWKLARVIQVHLDSDDPKKLVRTVGVKQLTEHTNLL
ncbi:unnamed protein product, partial [Allacma fusca]